jgi:hypothetical protein
MSNLAFGTAVFTLIVVTVLLWAAWSLIGPGKLG